MNTNYRFKFTRHFLIVLFLSMLVSCSQQNNNKAADGSLSAESSISAEGSSIVTDGSIVNDVEKIREQTAKMFRGITNAEITKAPAKNVYQIAFDTGGFAYAYVEGDFVLLGDLYNVEEQVNLAQKATNDAMVAAIDAVPTSQMIVYGPEDAKRHITVFTDIDCGFCRKLHNEVPLLTEAGIQVRYMAYPRAGIPSGSYDKYQSVWCNDDKNQALTDAKAGKSVPSAICENPIAETFAIGKKVGVRGTPTIVFDNGTVNPGYAPASDLIEQLGLNIGG